MKAPTPAPQPPRCHRLTIRQIMRATVVAAVLFTLAAPTARTQGWAAAFAFIGLYGLAMFILVRVIGQLGKPF